jgi:hypothetical protein
MSTPRRHPTPEERDERVSLYPLDFETAVAGLLAVKPESPDELAAEEMVSEGDPNDGPGGAPTAH